MTTTSKSAVIITSYIDYPLDIKSEISYDNILICTDGGYDIALKYDLRPDLLLGDFDSITSDLPKDIPIQRFNPEKDFTDLELALKKALEIGVSNVKILGGIGGRLDHTVANLQILAGYASKFQSLVIKDGRNTCSAHTGNPDKTIIIPEESGCYLSLFSLSEKCTGVNIEGVKYPLTDHTLTSTFPLGVSNEFKEKKAVLSFENGILLLIISKK